MKCVELKRLDIIRQRIRGVVQLDVEVELEIRNRVAKSAGQTQYHADIVRDGCYRDLGL